MSLFRSMVEGIMQLRADVSGAPGPLDDFWYNAIGAPSSTGMRITADTAKRVAAVHACVAIIGRTVAMLPLKLYQEEADGGKHAAPQHPLFDVLYCTPNQFQTAFEFRQMMQGHLELRGNAYAEIVDGRSTGPYRAIDQLLPMHPDRVEVRRNQSGRLQYKYNDPLTNTTRPLDQQQVFHLRNWSDDGVTGQSTVAMGADTFGVALAAQEYTARFFQNDAKPGMYIEGARFKNDEERAAFLGKLQAEQTGANRHKTMVLPPGLSVKELGIKPSDAQLLDARKFSRIEISSLFGVPPHLIGETEKTATYASVEQFAIMFAVQCITPRLVNWEQTIARDLMLPQDRESFFPKFSMAALLRGDTAARYAAYQIGIQNGWLSQNDVRILEDMNPIVGGNQYWRPLNWAPLTQAVESPTDTADPQTGQGDLGQEGDTQPAALTERLRLLALSAADRCVRKEVSMLRKLIGRNANEEEISEFYVEHAQFISDVLHVSKEQAQAYCDSHVLIAHNPPLIERTGADELAKLAAGAALASTPPMQITVNPAPITLRPTIQVQHNPRKVVKLIKTPEGVTMGAEISEE